MTALNFGQVFCDLASITDAGIRAGELARAKPSKSTDIQIRQASQARRLRNTLNPELLRDAGNICYRRLGEICETALAGSHFVNQRGEKRCVSLNAALTL